MFMRFSSLQTDPNSNPYLTPVISCERWCSPCCSIFGGLHTAIMIFLTAGPWCYLYPILMCLCFFFFTDTGRTNTCHPSGWAQVFSCIPLLLPYVKRFTCMDSGPSGLIPTQGRTSHTTTMTRKEPSSPPSGKSPTSCLQSSSCSTGCTVKDWPNWPCRVVPKNLNLEVPNDCLKKCPNLS